jgi:hypothetical protein
VPLGSGEAGDARRGFTVDLACARVFGFERYVKDLAPGQGSPAFRCLLHHPDTSPSAGLLVGYGGDLLYHCFHREALTLTLPQLRASLAYGQPTKCKGLLNAVWRYRLLYDAGLMCPAIVPHRTLPDDVKESRRRVFEGFLLLVGLKWKDAPYWGQPVTWTWRFAAAWCGLNERTAAEAMRWLLSCGYVYEVGKHPGAFGNETSLFLPMPPDEKADIALDGLADG